VEYINANMKSIGFDSSATVVIPGIWDVYQRLGDDAYVAGWAAETGSEYVAKGVPGGALAHVRDFFRNRKFLRQLIKDQTVQIPVIVAAAVPGGTATVTYSVDRSGDGGASLKICGSGGGAGFKTKVAESLEFTAPAEKTCSLVTEVAVNAYLFEQDGEPRVVTDIEPKSKAFIAITSPVPAAQTTGGLLVASLTGMGTEGSSKYTYVAERSYSWNVDLGLETGVAGLKVEAGINFEASEVRSTEVEFTLPNGYDYYAYNWISGIQLVPRILPLL
jgi:hypothetical protein